MSILYDVVHSLESGDSSMTHSLLFSIIIPNYNKADNISALLSSIYNDYPYNDFEVIFMDDASTDISVEEARCFPARIFVSESNLGPATLRNMAVKEASGEYLLFMDSDVILAPDTLVNFRNLCLTRKFDAVLGLEVLPPVIDNWIGNYRTLQIQDNWGEYRTKETTAEAWGTTFGAMRRNLFNNIGGFNESYKGADVEDHELAAHMHGKQVILVAPNLAYRHSYPSAIELMKKQFRRASQMVKFKKKVLFTHSLYGWRFKISHLLAVAVFAGSLASIFDYHLLYFVIAALFLRAGSSFYLLSEALKMKGFVFAVYCFAISLIMSLCIVTGALYGKLLWTKK